MGNTGLALSHLTSKLPFSPCHHKMSLEHKTQGHCQSVGHCQTLKPQHNQLQTNARPEQQGVARGFVCFTFCLRCWRTPLWPTVCPGSQQPQGFSASHPQTKTRWLHCGVSERAIKDQ